MSKRKNETELPETESMETELTETGPIEETELTETEPMKTELASPNITKAESAIIQKFLNSVASDLPCSTLLELARKASQPERLRATDYIDLYKTTNDLGVTYNYISISYMLKLKDSELQNTKALNKCISDSLQMYRNSPYHQNGQGSETRVRTMLELIFLDRLHNLSDQDAVRKFQFTPEVSISTETTKPGLNKKIIGGRADWTFCHDNDTKQQSESTLIVTEAKTAGRASVGLAQLLIYMVGIQQARCKRTNPSVFNQSVFGILTDASEFKFAFLDRNKKFYVSKPKVWSVDQSDILAYIDAILLDGIESSPHTTPTRKGNAVLKNYQQRLEQRWVFGDESEERAKKALKRETELVDVDEKGIVVGREKPKVDE